MSIRACCCALGSSQSKSGAAWSTRARDQGGPRLPGHCGQGPPLLTRDHAHRLPQSVAQQIIGVFHPPGAPRRTAVEGRPQLPRPKAATGGGEEIQRAFHETAVHLLSKQALAKRHPECLPEGRRVAIQTIKHHLPAPIHRGGFNDFVIRHPAIGWQERRECQLGRRDWRMALGAILIEGAQFVLKGVGKEGMAMMPQEDKQFGTADTLDDGVFVPVDNSISRRYHWDGRMEDPPC